MPQAVMRSWVTSEMSSGVSHKIDSPNLDNYHNWVRRDIFCPAGPYLCEGLGLEPYCTTGVFRFQQKICSDEPSFGPNFFRAGFNLARKFHFLPSPRWAELSLKLLWNVELKPSQAQIWVCYQAKPIQPSSNCLTWATWSSGQLATLWLVSIG